MQFEHGAEQRGGSSQSRGELLSASLPNSPIDRMLILSQQAQVLIQVGQFPQAEPLAREAYELAKSHLTTGDIRIPKIMNEYAFSCLQTGKYAIADTVYQEIHESALKSAQPDYETIYFSLHNRAKLQIRAGDAALSKNLAASGLEVVRAHDSLAGYEVPAIFFLAETLQLEGNRLAAAERISEAFATLSSKPESGDPSLTRNSLQSLSRVFIGQLAFAEGIWCAKEAVRIIGADPKLSQSLLELNALEFLAEVQQRTGFHRDALETSRRALELLERKQTFWTGHPALVHAQFQIDRAELGEQREAYDALIEIFDQAIERDDPPEVIRKIRTMLADISYERGDFADTNRFIATNQREIFSLLPPSVNELLQQRPEDISEELPEILAGIQASEREQVIMRLRELMPLDYFSAKMDIYRDDPTTSLTATLRRHGLSDVLNDSGASGSLQNFKMRHDEGKSTEDLLAGIEEMLHDSKRENSLEELSLRLYAASYCRELGQSEGSETHLDRAEFLYQKLLAHDDSIVHFGLVYHYCVVNQDLGRVDHALTVIQKLCSTYEKSSLSEGPQYLLALQLLDSLLPEESNSTVSERVIQMRQRLEEKNPGYSF